MEDSLTIELEESSVETNHSCHLFLVGKLITTKIIRKQGVINTLNGAWVTKKGFTITHWGDNRYCFAFKTKEDMDKIEAFSPWSVMGNLMVLRKWEAHQTEGDIDFSSSPFWIQVHGLPLNLMTKENGTLIGANLGHTLFVENPISEDGRVSQFLRLRVLIDITKPLRQSFNVIRKSGNPLRVHFRYERLSDFCYRCGCIGHGVEECPSPPHSSGRNPYGPSLRAAPARNQPIQSSRQATEEIFDVTSTVAPPNKISSETARPHHLPAPRDESPIQQSSVREVGATWEFSSITTPCNDSTILDGEREVGWQIQRTTKGTGTPILLSGSGYIVEEPPDSPIKRASLLIPQIPHLPTSNDFLGPENITTDQYLVTSFQKNTLNNDVSNLQVCSTPNNTLKNDAVSISTLSKKSTLNPHFNDIKLEGIFQNLLSLKRTADSSELSIEPPASKTLKSGKATYPSTNLKPLSIAQGSPFQSPTSHMNNKYPDILALSSPPQARQLIPRRKRSAHLSLNPSNLIDVPVHIENPSPMDYSHDEQKHCLSELSSIPKFPDSTERVVVADPKQPQPRC